jgi:hypothetical protein
MDRPIMFVAMDLNDFPFPWVCWHHSSLLSDGSFFFSLYLVYFANEKKAALPKQKRPSGAALKDAACFKR